MTVPLRVERALLTCGVVGPPLFVVAFLVEGATRAGYDPMRHPVSALALGELWWTQTASFIVTGLLLVAFAAGLAPALRRRYEAGPWAPVLVGMMGVGLIGAGVFPTDPVSGYPAGTPMLLPVPTDDGMLHDAFSAPVFLALPVACCVVGYRFARAGRTAWAVYSFLTAPAFLAGFVLASGGFSQSPALMPIGGLLQRLTLVIGWVWLTALAAHLLRAENQSPVRGEMG